MNSTPLIEKLSDMDSDYQELIYFGMMRTRDSNEWIIDYDNPVLYEYYVFYE